MSLNQEEEEYIERLYREMYTRLCIYAMSALGSKALAEEVVQDTFRIACIKPDGLMSSKNPRGWLVNTLKNVIRNRRRTEASSVSGCRTGAGQTQSSIDRCAAPSACPFDRSRYKRPAADRRLPFSDIPVHRLAAALCAQKFRFLGSE